MVYPFRLICLIWLFGLSWTASAQQTAFPACAQRCLVSAFSTKTCSPTDQECICTNEMFQSNVTLCFATSCTTPEALLTKNITLTTCGAPVRDRGQKYVVLSNVMISLTAVFVIIRFGFKIIVTQLDIGYDDWSVVLTLLSAVPSAIITVYGAVKNGLGQDIWTLRPEETTKMLECLYVMAILYFMQVMLLKLTLVFFYIRVFPGAKVQRILWGTVVFVCLWGFISVITAIFQCRPLRHFWTSWDGLHEGTCLDANAILSSNAGISIALDFWILGVPLWQLWGLKMDWKRKFGVALMFCVGTFVTIVSILRLQALVHLAASSNASWEFYDVSVWSTIEICVGIMCACLPTLRLLLVKLFPVLGGSSNRGQQNYYNYGSGNELRNMDRSNKSNLPAPGVLTSCRSPQSGLYPPDHGIAVETSYTVKRSLSDTDEASLVSHEVRGKA